MVFIPIDDNKEDEEAEDDDYTDEEFYKVKRELENAAIQVVYKIRDLEDAAKEALLELEEEIAKFVIDPHIEGLIEKYRNRNNISFAINRKI